MIIMTYKHQFTTEEIVRMSYVELLASIEEVNRPPGGKDSVRFVVQNCFLNKDSCVLDVGCNTGYVSFEIAHLAQCRVTGVDISPEMISAANRLRRLESNTKLVNFEIADGMNLPFKNETFDLVVSGGSTAFIKNKIRALSEYARVVKHWGFVADINFFYKKRPPQNMLNQLNNAMKINIQPWDENYWLEIYKKSGLEMYCSHKNNVYVPSANEIKHYCYVMAKQSYATPNARNVIEKRLRLLMTLFAKNHKYLAYGVFVLRKRPAPEQITLFGA
jgi:ubiquinone/menaquinone biosynthesis C-methylase UbiE